MKFNIANPATGKIKKFDFEEEHFYRPFFDKRVGQEVEADSLGPEFKGYILKITGGCDKQGFPMMTGVATNNRVKLLLDGRTGCYKPLRNGERRRKTVRGAVVANDIAVLNAVIVKKGEGEIEGVTGEPLPMRRGPKRASKIRKLFNLGQKMMSRSLSSEEQSIERNQRKESQQQDQRLQRSKDSSHQEDSNTRLKNSKPRNSTRSLC